MYSKIVLTLLLIILFSSTAMAYDPWYCRMEHSGVEMPDKAAHFYRSYAATKVGIDWKIMVLFNIAFELNDKRRGVGYSWKDNVADFLGIAGAKYPIYVSWDDESIMLNIGLKF